MVKRIDRTEKQIDFIVIGPFTDNNKIAKGAIIISLIFMKFLMPVLSPRPSETHCQDSIRKKDNSFDIFYFSFFLKHHYSIAFCVWHQTLNK